jgi:Protein of unknown function (DUF2905)
MHNFGWMLIVVGLSIAAVGLLWLLVPAIPLLGRLPGDISFERGNFRGYFPLATCLVLSALLTGIFWLVRLFAR